MFGKFLIIKRLAGLIWALSFFSLKSSVNFTSQNIPIENGLKKKVTWSYKGNDFKTVLSFFEKESGYFFQYDPGLIPSKKQFNIEYKQAVLGGVLRDFLQQNALDVQSFDTLKTNELITFCDILLTLLHFRILPRRHSLLTVFATSLM